jgi:multisubunit Na+/H+ antiporter MnhB subunit
MEFLLYSLIVFMIAGSIIAIETKDLLSSVICVGAVGLGLAIIFLMLGAPDLAIVQVAVEVLSLVLLLRVVVTREDVTIAHRYRYGEVFATATALVFFGVFIVLASVAYKEMPQFGQPILKVSQDYIASGFNKAGAPNLVTGVLLDFRAYDTLGEATVIFTAIIGSLVILRRRGRIRHERDEPHS